MNTNSVSQARFKLVLLPIILVLSYVLSVYLGDEIVPNTPFLVFYGNPGTAVKERSDCISYDNALVRLSNFTSVKLVSVKEVDEGLDPLDPRRTPYISALVNYLRPVKQGRAKFIAANTSEYRKLIRRNNAELLFPGNSIRAVTGLYSIALRLILALTLGSTYFLKGRHTNLADAMQILPFIGLFVSDSLSLRLLLNSLTAFYIGLLYLNEERSRFFTQKSRRLTYYALIVYACTSYWVSAESVIQAVIPILIFIFPVCSLEFENIVKEKNRRRKFHPVFSPVSILPNGLGSKKRGPGRLYFTALAVISIALAAFGLYSPGEHDGENLNKPPELTVDGMIRNAAYQTGYLYNLGYVDPKETTHVTLPTYIESDENVSFKNVSVKEFTDDWYKDIIATTQPLLLAFLNERSSAVSEISDEIIYLYLPFAVLPAILYVLRRIFRQMEIGKSGLSQIISNP